MLTKKETLRLLKKINKALDQAHKSWDKIEHNLEKKIAGTSIEPNKEAA